MTHSDVLHYLQCKLRTALRPDTPVSSFCLLPVEIAQSSHYLLPHHSTQCFQLEKQRLFTVFPQFTMNS